MNADVGNHAFLDKTVFRKFCYKIFFLFVGEFYWAGRPVFPLQVVSLFFSLFFYFVPVFHGWLPMRERYQASISEFISFFLV